MTNKINFSCPLDFKTMLTKHYATQVLLGFKNTPLHFNWNFPIDRSVITKFKTLRELDRGENGIKASLV